MLKCLLFFVSLQKLFLMDMIDRPTMISVLKERMEQLCQLGNADVQRLGRELERTPGDAELWFELGLAHNQTGLQYLDMAAQKAHLEYLEANPEAEEMPDTFTVEASETMTMFGNALTAFDKVLELMPDYYGVQCQRGIALANMHRYEEAEQCYLKALEEDEEDFTAASYLAMVYRDMGKDDLADKYQTLSQELSEKSSLEE